MIPVTLMLDKSRAVGAELPQVPSKGDLVVFSGMRWQVTKVTWVLNERAVNCIDCTDVFVSLRGLGV